MVTSNSRLPGLKSYFSDTLRRNALYLMTANGLSAVFGFAFWIIAARYYSTEEVGIASALISAMNLLTILAKLGFDWGILRFLSKAPDRSAVINTCFTIATALSLVSVLIFVSGMDFWAPKLIFLRENWFYWILLIAFTLSTSISMLQGQIFIAFRASEYVFIQNVISGIRFIAVGFLVFMGSIGIFTSVTLSSVLVVVAGIFFLIKVYPGYRQSVTIDRNAFKNLFSFSMSNYVTNILAAIPIFTMPLILIHVVDNAASAYFNIAYSISMVIGIVISSTTTSLLAEASYDPKQLRPQILKAMKFSFAFILVGILALIIFGKKILSIYGADYAENSLWLLWLFALTYIPATINSLYFTAMRVQLKMKSLIISHGAVGILIFCIGYPLLTRIGLIGVGIAFFAANAIVAIVAGTILCKLMGFSLKSLPRISPQKP